MDPTGEILNFLGGAGGSAANQYVSDGEIDPRTSITRGLTNAIEQIPYGTDPLKSAKDAFGRGFKTGAATTAINYISDHIGTGISSAYGILQWRQHWAESFRDLG